MTSSTISSLGVGSGFELQEMLDNLREVDKIPINLKEEKKVEAEERLTEFNETNAKLLTMKSHALTLSLESTFLERNVSVSDEDVVTASVLTGTSDSSNSLEVVRMATRSSWQTAGVASEDTPVYIPTIQESTTGFLDTDSTAAIANDDWLTIAYGSGDNQHAIAVDLSAGMTLNQIVQAINSDDSNDAGDGSTYVTASTSEGDDGAYYLKIASTAADSTEDNRITLTESPKNLDFASPDVTFTYSLGSDSDPVTVTVAADTTYAQLAEQINSDTTNPGITARVIDDGTKTAPYRLVLTADATGEDNRISVNGIQMTEVQGADGESLNAEIKANGITFQRESNTGIDNVLQGITLNLESTGTATVKVTSNSESIQTEITGLVESFNELVQEINSNSGYNEETEKWGPLASSSTVKNIPNELGALMGTLIKTGGTITSLYDLGMEFNQDGTITIDEDLLSRAVSSNADSIKALFISNDDTQLTGLGDLLNDSLREITRSSGIIDTEKDAAQDEVNRLEASIESATERLDRRYEAMTRQFVKLDAMIGKIQSQSDYLSNMIDSFNSTSSN